MNEAAMLIRFCYADDYDEAERVWRFQWFREQTLPRILAQEGADFDLWLWVNPKHRAEVEAMSPRIQTFTVETPTIALESRHHWRTTKGLPRYPIQMRVDSDDLIGPRYVRRALAALAEMKAERALVWFQPYKLDVTTGRVYWCVPGRGRGSYGDDKPSAFLALRQPVVRTGYKWVYGIGHTKAHLLVDRVTSIGEGHCWAACHAFNDSTHVNPKDRYVGMFDGWTVPA